MKPTAKSRRREKQLIYELRTQHGYMFMELSRDAERQTMMTSMKGGKLTIEPANCIRLCVPADGHLGQEIESMRKAKVKQRRKPQRKNRGPAWEMVIPPDDRLELRNSPKENPPPAVRRLLVPGGWLYQVESHVECDGERIGNACIINERYWHPPVFVSLVDAKILQAVRP